MLGIRLVRNAHVLEGSEAGLLVSPDRARVLDRWADDALRHVVAREDDVAEEGPDELRAVALPDQDGLADEQVDARRRDIECEGGAVLVMVVDPVALDEADRPPVMADEEDLGRVTVSADALAVLLELVVGIRGAGRVGPPPADVRLEEPAADERQVRLGQWREVVLRRIA